jgi:uncharacterized protein (TIGR00369 family)
LEGGAESALKADASDFRSEAHMTTSHYGLANPQEAAGMSGKEFLQAIIEGRLPQPPIAEPMTFRIVEVGDGFAVFEGDPGPHLLNPMGTVHGGWALTLIDSATGCAALSLLPAGSVYTTIETKANFSKPIKEDTGRVRVEGRIVSAGRQIISAEARVLTQDGRVLAHGTSTLMVLAARPAAATGTNED